MASRRGGYSSRRSQGRKLPAVPGRQDQPGGYVTRKCQAGRHGECRNCTCECHRKGP
jgi:hypothetical protein